MQETPVCDPAVINAHPAAKNYRDRVVTLQRILASGRLVSAGDLEMALLAAQSLTDAGIASVPDERSIHAYFEVRIMADDSLDRLGIDDQLAHDSMARFRGLTVGEFARRRGHSHLLSLMSTDEYNELRRRLRASGIVGY